jgi:hypothetical protein
MTPEHIDTITRAKAVLAFPKPDVRQHRADLANAYNEVCKLPQHGNVTIRSLKKRLGKSLTDADELIRRLDGRNG